HRPDLLQDTSTAGATDGHEHKDTAGGRDSRVHPVAPEAEAGSEVQGPAADGEVPREGAVAHEEEGRAGAGGRDAVSGDAARVGEASQRGRGGAAEGGVGGAGESAKRL